MVNERMVTRSCRAGGAGAAAGGVLMRGDEHGKHWLPAVRRPRLAGTPLTIGPYLVTPVSRVLVVRLPFGVMRWQRPDGVLVARDGEVRRLPIPDITRRVRAGIFGALVLVSIGLGINTRRKETGS
jgi:hypothetical protein